jgi:5'-3' exonuclease
MSCNKISNKISNKTKIKNMGIKNLNQFVRRECSDAIKNITLSTLSGKVVVVDASIFMYRFLADDALLENMYTMISLFKLHGIVPVFIFDGKPPDEKRNTLNRRRHLKHVAEMQYNRRLIESAATTATTTMTTENKAAEEQWLKIMRRRFIRISDADFERVWTLMRALGVQYIVAPGEADAMCAQMVLKRKAYACMSDDTDLFVYGCSRVLRHMNLMDETVTLYEMSKILNLLGITMTEFRQICVISGTDYSCGRMHGLTLKNALLLFKQYKKCAHDAEKDGNIFAPDFYTWLHHHANNNNHNNNHDKTLMTRVKFDYDATMTVHNMFDMTTIATQLPVITSAMSTNKELLHEVMAHENFIFVE